MQRLPTSSAEFHLAMQSIDAKLQSANIAIPHRLLHAALEYYKVSGVEVVLFNKQVGDVGVYGGPDAGAHIAAWYDGQYGERTHQQDGIASMAVVLRGDPWEARLCRIYGTVRVVADPEIDAYAHSPNIAGPDEPVVVLNAVAQVRHLPRQVAMELGADDCRSLLRQCQIGLAGCNAIARMFGLPFISEVESDISAGVRHMIGPPPHFGQARYAHSQAAEKLLKCALTIKQISFEFIHDIAKLASLLHGHAAMVPLSPKWITDASARSGMRYGDVPVSMSEAVDAQNAAFHIARHVHASLMPELEASRLQGTRTGGS